MARDEVAFRFNYLFLNDILSMVFNLPAAIALLNFILLTRGDIKLCTIM